MDDFLVRALSKNGYYFRGRSAGNSPKLIRTVVRKPASELFVVLAAQGNDISLLEASLDSPDANRKQTSAFFFNCLLCAGVHHQTPHRLSSQPDPSFARCNGWTLGQDQGSNRLAGQNICNYIRLPAI